MIQCMKVNCPECKNDIDTSAHSSLSEKQIIECDKCGITLEITGIEGDRVETEIVDEGK